MSKLERRNPLPPGRYWSDFIGPKRALFQAWRAEHAAFAKVRSNETHDDEDPPRDWVLWETTEPLPWDAVALGFPTIAPESGTGAVHSSADTVDRPDPTPAPTVNDIITTIALTALAGVISHVIITKLFERK